MITVGFVLSVSFVLFLLGCVSLVVNKKNLIFVLIAFEIILLAAGINFVTFSHVFNDIEGQIVALFVLAVAACEVGVGLALLTVHFKATGTIEIDDLSNIKD